MSDVTIVPVSQEFIVLTEDTGTIVINTNSVLQSGGTVDLTNYYTKSEADLLLAGKTDVGHTHVIANITDFDTAHINGGAF